MKKKKKKKHYTYQTIKQQSTKTYLQTYAPNEDSNYPAHLRSRIRVFAVRVKKNCILDWLKLAQWRISLGTFPDATIQVNLGLLITQEKMLTASVLIEPFVSGRLCIFVCKDNSLDLY